MNRDLLNPLIPSDTASDYSGVCTVTRQIKTIPVGEERWDVSAKGPTSVKHIYGRVPETAFVPGGYNTSAYTDLTRGSQMTTSSTNSFTESRCGLARATTVLSSGDSGPQSKYPYRRIARPTGTLYEADFSLRVEGPHAGVGRGKRLSYHPKTYPYTDRYVREMPVYADYVLPYRETMVKRDSDEFTGFSVEGEVYDPYTDPRP